MALGVKESVGVGELDPVKVAGTEALAVAEKARDRLGELLLELHHEPLLGKLLSALADEPLDTVGDSVEDSVSRAVRE
jgi:hypothetical protein